MSGSAEAQVNAITANVQPNPLSTPQGVLGLAQGLNANQNQILQNTSLSRDLRAKQAIGQALSQNTGPDGSVDIQNVIQQSKSDPDLAYGLSSLIPESQQSNVTSQNFHQMVYQTALQRTGSVANEVQGLLELGPNLSYDKLVAASQALLTQHPGDNLLYGDVQQVLNGAPKNAGPQALALYLTPYAKQAQDALAQLTAQIGGSGNINTGGTQQGYTIDPQTGQRVLTGQSVPNTESPDTAGTVETISSPGPNAQHPNWPPVNTPLSLSQAQLLGITGQGGLLPPNATGAGAAPAPQVPNQPPAPGDLAPLTGPLGNTPLPGAGVAPGTPGGGPAGGTAPLNPANPAQVQAVVNSAPPAAPAAALPAPAQIGAATGPTPTASAVATGDAKATGDTLNSLDVSIPAQQKLMSTQQEIMNLLSTVKTGGGASTRAAIAQDFQKITGGLLPDSVANAIAGGGSGGQAATQTLIKLLNNSVVNQFQAAGLGHNDEFSALQGANYDVDKTVDVYKNLYNMQANNLAYDQAQQDFYKNHQNDTNVPEKWAAYAKTSNLTPDNATTWASVNSPDSVLGGGTRLLQMAQQGNPGAQKALALLKAHPGVPIPRADGKGAYVYDPTSGEIAVVPTAGKGQ